MNVYRPTDVVAPTWNAQFWLWMVWCWKIVRRSTVDTFQAALLAVRYLLCAAVWLIAAPLLIAIMYRFAVLFRQKSFDGAAVAELAVEGYLVALCLAMVAIAGISFREYLTHMITL